MKRLSFYLILFLLALTTVHAQDVRTQLRQIATDLSKQIAAKNKSRVVIFSFLDLKNQETQLGRYMADKFSIGMIASSLQITDRSQLATLLSENKLNAKSILDPKTAPILGKITGAQVIITGNYTVLDNTLDITVKAIELERGLILALSEGSVPRTSEINKLLDEIVPISGIDPVIPGNPGGVKGTPKPAPDCETNPSCVICVTNKSTQPVIAALNMSAFNGYKEFHIEPGKVKCWQAVPFSAQEDYGRISVVYKSEKQDHLKVDQFVILRCKTYNKEFTN